MRSLAARRLLAAGLLVACACGDGRRANGVREGRAAATASAAATGPARMVKDLRLATRAAGSSPSRYVLSDGLLWFFADDGVAGREPWRTDGTEAGTVRVRDVFPGEASSVPSLSSSLTAFAGGVLFAADDGAHGAELWRADAAGASLVKDLQPGSRGSSPHAFAVVGDRVYFAAETAEQGIELWQTDGTELGTTLVADVLPGPAGSSPTDIAALGTTVYFAANGGDAVGVVLFRMAGGAPEAVRSNTGARVPDAAQLTAAGGRLYFAARTAPGGPVQLWSTDGSDTRPVGNVSANPTDPSLLTPFGATLCYRARAVDGTGGLYVTDGQAQTRLTVAGLGLALDPAELLATPARLWVSGATPATGRELFAFDGATLALVKDVEPGPSPSSPAGLALVNGTLLFGAGGPTVIGARLWQSDGTAGGTFAVAAAAGFRVGAIAALGTRAVLTADDGASGEEPWIANVPAPGQVTAPLALLRNVHADLSSSDPADLTPFGGRLFFSADLGPDLVGAAVDRELWSTDGTEARTSLAWDVWFLSNGSVAGLVDGGDLVPCGPPEAPRTCGGLLFAAFDEADGRELWRWDGAPAATPARDIRPGGQSSAPAELTRVGAAVLFVANDGVSGSELWRTDGTSAGTTLVADLRTGPASSSPAGLTAANGLLFFGATVNGFDRVPYRSDGTLAGTRSIEVADNLFDPIVAPAGFAALGTDVLFSAATGVVFDDLGRELFRYSPATGRTTLVKDLAPGPASSDPTRVVARGALGYFGASDGSGVKLWSTDGTAPGTSPVRALGTLGGGAVGDAVSLDVDGAPRLFFVGDDEVSGPELWTSDGTAAGTALVRDVFPGPTGSAAGSVLLPLPARGHVLYAASDGRSGRELWISNGTPLGTRLLQDLRPGPESSNPRDLVAMGEIVYFTADDGAAGRELWVLDASPAALDLTPPVPQCAPVTVEAEGPQGARPQLAITATDDVSAPAEMTFAFDPAQGTIFRLGTTRVVATAFDAAGNAAQCTFDLTVADTTPPLMTCPNPPPFEATSAAGAAAAYPPVGAVDLVSGEVPVVYTREAGSSFPLGDTVVTATGADAAGNQVSCDFTVTVHDTTGPALTCPADVVADATGFSGAIVTYPAATATDLVTAPDAIALAYAPPTGSTFPIATTPVVVVGRDAAGNEGRCTFGVVVVDATPPAITCPGPVTAEATSPAGAAPGWPPASATDLETPSPGIDYAPPPGTTFPIRTTAVVATATDGGGNQATCTFQVAVVDTTPPTVSCVGLDSVAEASGPEGATVAYPPASASDVATAEVAVAYAAEVGGVVLPAPSGGTFPRGDTAVVATATDGAGLTAACSFTVTVQDTTAPIPSCPDPIVLEAASAAGAVATFSATATDTVDPAPAVSTSARSGDTFAIGTTVVTATAQDASLNVASCTFPVTVADTTAPTVACPGDVAVEAPGPTPVELPAATASDSVTVSPVVTPSVPSGSVFDVGTTTVTYTARDAAGNAATCTVRVTVSVPPEEGGGGCGCGSGGGGSLTLGAVLVALLRRRSRAGAARG